MGRGVVVVVVVVVLEVVLPLSPYGLSVGSASRVGSGVVVMLTKITSGSGEGRRIVPFSGHKHSGISYPMCSHHVWFVQFEMLGSGSGGGTANGT